MTSPTTMAVILAVRSLTTKYAYVRKVALQLHVEMVKSSHHFAIRAILVDKELVLKLAELNVIQ